MTSSDGFGSGIFDDEIEEVTEEPQKVETPSKATEEEPPKAPSRPRRAPQRKEKAESADPKEGDEEAPARPARPARRPRRDDEDRGGRGRSRTGRESSRSSREGGREGSREGSREGGRPPRRRDDGGQRPTRRGRNEGEDITPSGVATGMGEIPAGSLINQRVALLVDADLMDKEAQDQHDARVSYRKLFAHAVQGRSAVRAIAYTSEEEKDSRAPFHDHLLTSGFELVSRIGAGAGKWDVQITLDALSLAEKVDTIVIASSRDTLIPLVELLRSKGVRVETASFAQNPLARTCQTFVPLDKKAIYTP